MGKGAKTRTARSFDMEEPSSPFVPSLRAPEEHPKTVVQPTKFFGEPGDDIEKWLKSFDRISKANGWSQKRQCDILPAFLRDRAAEFYDELPDRQQNNLDELKTALIEHFIPKEARRFYYADLYSRRQGETEPSEDFGREIQQLVRRAYAEMPVEHQDTLMREHFVNGLRPALKRIVLISDPKDFQKALEVAKREEINDQVSNGSAPWVRSVPSSSQACAAPIAAISGEQRLNDRMDRLESLVEKLAVAVAESKRPAPEKPPNFGRKYNWNSSDRNLRCTDGRPICNYCKKVGHVEPKCREKIAASQDQKN